MMYLIKSPTGAFCVSKKVENIIMHLFKIYLRKNVILSEL